MKKFSPFWAGLFLLLLGICAGCGKETGSIHGKIGKGGEPAADVQVWINVIGKDGERNDATTAFYSHTRTDTRGNFIFDNLTSDRYYLTIHLPAQGGAMCETAVLGFTSKLETVGAGTNEVVATNRAAPLYIKAGDDVTLDVKFDCPLESFNSYLREYISLAEGSQAAFLLQDPFSQLKEETRDTPYLTGKVIIVNERGIDDLYYKIPQELRASNPDEVGTVIFIKEEIRDIDTYAEVPVSPSTNLGNSDSPRPSYKTTSKVFLQATLVDKKREAVLIKKSFAGSTPTFDTRHLGRSKETFDDNVVVKYLLELPRR